MQAGGAKILRNTGARVTEAVLQTLVLAYFLLGVSRVLVMPHPDCRMAISDEAIIHVTIKNQFGVDISSLEFRTSSNQRESLVEDVARIRLYPFLHKADSVAGSIDNISSGQLRPFDCRYEKKKS